MFNLVPGLFAITLFMLVSVAGLVMVQRLVPLELRKVSRWHRSREGEAEV